MILTPHQRAALRVLSAAGPVPASVLARAIGHTHTEAADFARRLAGRGFVRVEGGVRGHSPLVALTPKGRSAAVAALALVAAVLPGRAGAQQQPAPCGKLAELDAELSERFHETRIDRGTIDRATIGRGTIATGALLVIYASPDGDTWTAVTVQPTGTACVVGYGRRWEQGSAPAAGDRS